MHTDGRLEPSRLCAVLQVRLAVPVCAKCQKVVTDFKVYRRDALRETSFVAFCHGKMQSVVLRDYDVAQATKIEVTEAFAE
jgi:hypothetical protein